MKMNKKGFTIVELVIVIAVIAILAGVLIPTFSGLVQKAQDSAAIQEARNKYTEYVGANDYTKGEPAQNIVIEVDDQYVIVKDAKLVDKVYDNKDVAKNDAKYSDTKAAAFLCEECNDVTTDTDEICDDCGKCVEHVDEINNETEANGADKLCDVCGACDEHTWQQDPATGVCTVCYEECEHEYADGATTGAPCGKNCGVTKQ